MKSSILQRPVKKVILVFPPVTIPNFCLKICCPPMGIAYLGAVLRNRYEVRLLDAVVEGHHIEKHITPHIFQFGLDTDMIMERILAFEPDVVGLSCLFSNQFPVVIEIAKRVKTWNKEIVTVTGGTHPTFLPERCLREEALDYIIMGEAEESLPALLKAIEIGNGQKEIDGLAFRINDHMELSPKTSWIKDLDSLSFPARDLLPLQKYFNINLPFSYFSKSSRNTSLITSRGCPCRCNFCSSTNYWGNHYRTRSPENVLAELEHLKTAYGIEEVQFEDDNLTCDTKRAKAIFRGMIDRELNLLWCLPNGVMIKTLADNELVKLMKKSGCYELTLPFESGDQWVLDNIINKPVDLEAARDILHSISEEGIDIHAYFIVGFPREKLSQIKNTFVYLRSLNIDKIVIFFFNPLPGTPLFKECIDRGLISNELETEKNNYFISAISDQDWTHELLEKMVWREYYRFTFFYIFRRPWKFLSKYLKRRLRRDGIQTFFHEMVKNIYRFSK